MESSLIVDAGGIETFLYCEGSGPGIVLLHGWASAADIWQPVFDDLKADYQVIAPDMPGHGRTEGGSLPYGLAFYQRWLAGMLDALSLPEATLIGNSMGGAVSLAYTRAHAERVARLVLVNALGLSDEIPWETAPRLVRRMPHLVAAAITGQADPHLLRWVDSMIVADPWGQPREAILETIRVNVRQGIWPLWSGLRLLLADFLLPGRRRDFARRLADIGVPTLIVWGRHDGLLPVAHAFAGAEAIPDSQVAVLEGSSHEPMLEQPEEFVSLVREFLDGAG